MNDDDKPVILATLRTGPKGITSERTVAVGKSPTGASLFISDQSGDRSKVLEVIFGHDEALLIISDIAAALLG